MVLWQQGKEQEILLDAKKFIISRVVFNLFLGVEVIENLKKAICYMHLPEKYKYTQILQMISEASPTT